ncbi:hypothetical protein [Aquibacillus rhizosphaerae]|uniref:Uncharacterized protein n=1 Tax=Aquibacillus rhizosphaerae TaxID=3051431 RepID=A0ABT7L722_9BACI|nr:hypothetical protein [Aquibacillus sp. LR5S19]MDL4840411.1 hypothetical protein [Aquibacillus sp. LR5S19]
MKKPNQRLSRKLKNSERKLFLLINKTKMVDYHQARPMHYCNSFKMLEDRRNSKSE